MYTRLIFFKSLIPPSSVCNFPANILINVVFPVPFSPNITIISESVNWPCPIWSSKFPETSAKKMLKSTYKCVLCH